MTTLIAVSGLLRHARRRVFLQTALEQLAWGAVFGLGAFVLLLLTGTQILRWYWPLLILVVTVAIGWWRGRHRVPREYETVCRLDRDLGAGDLLATAWHFSRNSSNRDVRQHFLEPVERDAESLAAGADAALILPWRRPSATLPLLALVLVAGTIFAVRYGVTGSIDLRGPIAEVRFDTLTGAPLPAENKASAKKPGMPLPAGVTLPDGDRADVNDSAFAREEEMKNFEVASNEMGRPGKGDEGRRAQSPSESGDEGEAGSEEGEEPGDSNEPSGSKEPGKNEGKNAAPKKPENDGGLMDKMRDALANLMEKLKIEPKGGDSQQMASNKKGGAKSGEGKKSGEKGKQSKGKDASDQQGDQAQGDQAGEGDQSQMAKAQGEQGTEEPSKSEKSGVGSQDGRKDTDLAEQAEAMGKLSEILGKRAQNLQGEIMVEVNNSKNQQARTPYLDRKSSHTEAGGEINRDEVPLHLQHYVQQYYEQVRKQPAPPAATPALKQ